ncbi:MAG TPA: hypothetical protein EYP41_14520 [Anaerolineae bacterium]|nr:hypothetical protein [Anaerolineae bacterium]
MKQKWMFVMAILALALSACGLNPVEKLEEKAAEQVAEKIIEQASGAEDVQINVGDDSVSYAVTDDEGNEISVDVNEVANLDAFTGMGFTIPLPNGMVNGTMQEIEENDRVVMVQGVFEMEGLSVEEFYPAIHQSLTAAGFTYRDPLGGDSTAPDPTNPDFIPMVTYTHEDGYQFTIMGDASGIVLSIVAVQE